ncbi:MAG: hypothetical protein ACOCWH_00905 [Spirochaetota bacterium]
MEQTIQNLFAESPYFAFAGFVALVAVSLYIIKKLKNIIIALGIILVVLSVYLYRSDVLSGEVFSRLARAQSIDEVKEIYTVLIDSKKDEIRQKTKERIIDTLSEDLKQE